MFSNQRGNTAGRDVISAEKVEINNNQISKPTVLTRLYERFRSDRDKNELQAEMYEKLQHFCNVDAGGDVRGLAEKLTASQREDLIRQAERLKEQAAKIIMRWQTSGTAQDILAMILGKMHTAFTLNVNPAIQRNAPREDVDQLTYDRVIQHIEDMLGDNDLMISPDDLLGLLFFLAGNCHIRWDKVE